MLVKNDNPASAPGYFNWKGGDVVEVPDELAQQICAIKDAGFYGVSEADFSDEDETPAKRGPGRPRKVNTEVDPESDPA